MAEMGLAARPKKRRKATTRPGKGRWRAPDLVKRDFPAAGINHKWYGDGTEIPTDEGKLLPRPVLDMGSRRVLGFALGEHHDAELAYGALAMAVAVRGGTCPASSCTPTRAASTPRAASGRPAPRLSICQSMGRPGSALDNAVIESWHSTLEFELRRIEHFATRAAARAGVAAWIEEYNHHRRHSSLGQMSPVAWELSAGRERRPRERGRPLRGPEPEGGGFAAAHLYKRAAALRPGDAPREGTGPPLRRQACCASPAATALRAGLDPGDHCGPSGRKYGQAPACPRPGRGASGDPRARRTNGRQGTK